MTFAVSTLMLIAIPIWEGRVSPVFDVAQRVALSTIEADRVVRLAEMAIPSEDPATKVNLLAEQKVDVLLCGAISGCVLHLLEESNIRVVPYVCGPVDQVLSAFLENRLAECGMVMPGCGCGRGPGAGGGRRRRRGWCGNQQNSGRQSL